MKVWKTIAIAGVLIAPMAGAATVESPWAADGSGPELNLFNIYNEVYGTSLTASDLGAVQVPDALDQIFGNPEWYNVQFRATYSARSQEFGYVANADNIIPGDLNPLFTVETDGVVDMQDWASTERIPEDLDELPIAFYTFSEGLRFFFSVEDWNFDGGDHMVMLAGTDGTFLLGFEDGIFGLNSDSDYNDLVVQLRVVPTDPEPPIPEPATVALLGMGLAGLVWRRARTQH